MARMRPLFALLPVFFPSGSCAPAPQAPPREWSIVPDSAGGLTVALAGAPLITARHAFWGPDWRWAEARIRAAGGRLEGGVPDLGLELRGRAESQAPGRYAMEFVWRAGKERPITGGGFEFRLDPAFAGGKLVAELLPGKSGWRLPLEGGQELACRFDPPLAAVYFERGDRHRIRAWFFADSLPEGERRWTMTLALPEGGVVARPPAERYAPEEPRAWPRGLLPPPETFLDLSFLNDAHRPAGAEGFVRVEGDRLVYGKNSALRLWGCNVQAYALFSPPELVRRHARRIAALGFNLVRLHHHDSTAWVEPTVIDRGRPDSRGIDARGLGAIHWWVKCLKDEGIFVWLDLHIGRVPKAGDGIEGWEELAPAAERVGLRGFCYVNPGLRALMQEFNENYLKPVNPHTGKALGDEPAVAGMLITNENALVGHFGNLFLPDKGNPRHGGLFMAAARAFARRTGLAADRVWRPWEPGPAKLLLADLEHRWNREMIGHLRGLGVRAPLAPTNTWGGLALFGLPGLTAGDLIDVHAYGEAESLSFDPRVRADCVHWIGAAQVAGKPLAITEWNLAEFPAADRFTAPLKVAALACLQGWDAPMLYGYAQVALDRIDRSNNWSALADPALMGAMPAAALLFRQRHAAQAKETVRLRLTREQVFFQDVDPEKSLALRTAVERHRLVLELPDTPELEWDGAAPGAGGPAADLGRDYVAPGAAEIGSDTGELRRDWRRGVQWIDTPRTQAVQSWIGGAEFETADVRFGVQPPKALVAVTSLDGRPIRESRRLLVTALARALPAPGGRLPFASEPVAGLVELAGRESLRLFALDAGPRRPRPLSAERAGDRFRIRLSAADRTHWYLLAEE